MCANASPPAAQLHLLLPRSATASPSSSSSSLALKKASASSGAVRHEELPFLLPFAAAGLLSIATASAAHADTGVSLVEGFLSQEPSNALSLPTWTIHVASVVEWIVAMALVWKFGDNPKNAAWKGLTWGMVPLLGGAMCACTWHFFYNAESLEILVVLQAALTMVGNFTMWLAAYRIYRSSSKSY